MSRRRENVTKVSLQKRGKKLKYKCKIERLKYNPYIELIIKNNDQTETLMSSWDSNSKISNRASYESLLKENRVIGLRLGSFWCQKIFSLIGRLFRPIKMIKWIRKRGREKSLNSSVTCVGMSTLSIFPGPFNTFTVSTSTPLLIWATFRHLVIGQWHERWWYPAESKTRCHVL